MKRVLQILFPLIALSILLFVWNVSITNNGGWNQTFSGDKQSIFNIFKLLGLTAFCLLRFQIMIGPFIKLWVKLYGPGIYPFHYTQGTVAFVVALSHPILLYTFLYLSDIGILEFSKNYSLYYYFGPAALTILTITVVTAFLTHVLKKNIQNWRIIHYGSYIAFAIAYFHSTNAGTDVAGPGPLKILWNVFLVGAIIAFLYRRVYRPIKLRSEVSKINST